ncbi:hypothetical protein NX059_012036 [Plenodomus lindquistii]|nr:hypothetical protein NX059_012036 [Plenodomus lindquistii]
MVSEDATRCSPGVSTSKSESASVTVHALSGGHFTLPEYQFVHPVARDARRTVPSLCFLIQHRNIYSQKTTKIVFDLGLRRDVKRYAAPIQKHIQTRQPMTTEHDVTNSLANGGLTPQDIDYVIYSHVHWDHVGEPRNFPTSTFVVGHGAKALLGGAPSTLRGGHSFFESDLLPEGRTIELSNPTQEGLSKFDSGVSSCDANFYNPWESYGDLPNVLDLFGDGSLLIVDAPGHLQGHINLLARTPNGRQIYMAGDACHDRRLLTGEKTVGEWNDTEGHVCCIHADRKQAERTIEKIRDLEARGVEIIFAHDVDWENDPANKGRFLGAENS